MEETINAILAKAADGDQVAFRNLVERYKRKVSVVIYRMTCDIEEARDLTQEVFIRLYKALPDLDLKCDLFTWLYRVAMNLTIDHKRSQKSRDRVTGEMERLKQDNKINPDSRIEQGQVVGIIKKLTLDLTPRERQVFVLRDLQGLTSNEIAGILDCAVSTVRVHLAKARNYIKDRLSEDYPELLGGLNR